MTEIIARENVIINVEEIQNILRKAGTLFLDRSAAGEIKEKGTADYVTQVDVTVQKYIREILEEKYPYIQFLSEEKSNDEIDKMGSVWILDPVDGTTNLIHDYCASVISLALMEKGEVILGMIYNPYSKEMFYARKNGGCFCNGKSIRVSQATKLEDALIAIGTSPYYKELAEDNFKVFKKLFLDCQDIRRSGSAALDLAYVACGRIEGYFERNLKIWDFAAGMLMVREAGGKVMDFAGADAQPEMIVDIVAGNDKISNQMLEKYLQ